MKTGYCINSRHDICSHGERFKCDCECHENRVVRTDNGESIPLRGGTENTTWLCDEQYHRDCPGWDGRRELPCQCKCHKTKEKEMGEDRTDEIREAVMRSRITGWSLRLANAVQVLPANVYVAQAIIEDVMKEMSFLGDRR